MLSGGVGEQVVPHLVAVVVPVETRCGEQAVLTAGDDQLAFGLGALGVPVPGHALGVIGLAVRAARDLEHRGDPGYLAGRIERLGLRRLGCHWLELGRFGEVGGDVLIRNFSPSRVG